MGSFFLAGKCFRAHDHWSGPWRNLKIITCAEENHALYFQQDIKMSMIDILQREGQARGLRFIFINTLVACIYGILALAGLSFTIAGTGVSPVWPAAGFALAVFLLLGHRYWPGIFLAAVALTYIDFLMKGQLSLSAAFTVSLATGMGAVFEAMAGLYLLRYILGRGNPFNTVRGANIFFVSSFLISLVSCTIGLIARMLGGAVLSGYMNIWFTWWMGDVTAILVVTPYIFSLTRHREIRWTVKAVCEYFALTFLFIVTGVLVMGIIPSRVAHHALFFLLLPFLLWHVFRFSQREASLAVIIISAMSIYSTIHGMGPFESFSVNTSLIMLQSFVGVMAFIVNMVNAYAAERDSSHIQLNQINAALDRIITERTEELEQSEKRFRNIYNQSPLGIMIFDVKGDLVDLNPASLGIFGIMEIDDVLGINLFRNRIISADNKQELLDGRPVHFTTFTDFEEIRVSGLYEPARQGLAYIEAEISPIEKLGYLTQVKDITSQVLAETALKENEQRLRTIFDNAGIGIMIINDKFRCLDANNQWLSISGYSREEMMEQSILDITHPDDLVISREHLYALTTGNIDSYNIEKRYIKKDGSVMWGNLSVTPIRDSRGGVSTIIAVIVDITRRKSIQLRLKESEEFLRRVVDTTPNLIFVKNRKGEFTLVNKAVADIYNASIHDMVGKTDADFNPRSSEVDGYLHDDLDVMDSLKNVFIPEESITAPDGTVRWLQTIKVPIVDGDGVARHILGVSADITMLKEAQKKLLEMATHDSLTGLPNRRMLNDRLNEVIARSKRSERLIAVLFMDLDGFKDVNDNFGHNAGDMLLKQVAERLMEAVREIDLVSRMGGDEFTIILESVITVQDVIVVADRIIEIIQKPFDIGDASAHVTTSVGISIFPNDGLDAGTLLRKADNAMYKAKNSGKNHYTFYADQL